MVHTYFFQTANWTARGTYYDADGEVLPLSGAVQIEHSAAKWTLDGWLEVAADAPVCFVNRYAIRETGDPKALAWTSWNPVLGELEGRFEVVGGHILSYYRSPDGRYEGQEVLSIEDGDTYDNVGLALKDGARLSAWTARLTAEQEGN